LNQRPLGYEGVGTVHRRRHRTKGAGSYAPPFRLVWSAVGRSTRKMHGKFVRSARTLHGKAVRSQRARPLGGKTQGDLASPSQGAILPAGPSAPTRAPPVSCVRDDLHPWGTTVAAAHGVVVPWPVARDRRQPTRMTFWRRTTPRDSLCISPHPFRPDHDWAGPLHPFCSRALPRNVPARSPVTD